MEMLNAFVGGLTVILDISPRKASNLETTVIVSRTAGTTDAYRRAFFRWKSFASSRDEIQASSFSCQAGTCCSIPSVFDGHYSLV